ncbi:MAG: hypothetical protein JWN07_2296 [Hyphomicrobiales bacterium]|nr:hypothetical protein [Hyphomicrobiales bacterium]
MDDLASERRIFSARLTPHRSLSQANFRLLLVVVGLAGLFTALPFILMGAWPVAGFMGLDVLLVYVAFRASFRDARAYEDVTLTPLELHLAKVSAKGARADWRFNPSWVRLEKEEDEEFGLQRLSVASRGSHVEIARYLAPDDKARFATDLSHALAEARRGPRYN